MKKTNSPIWTVQDRPREKSVRIGLNSLSIPELIAILIRTGTKDKNAVQKIGRAHV